MKLITNKIFRTASVAMIAFAGLTFAQDQPQQQPNQGGWRRFGDATPAPQAGQRADTPETYPQDPGQPPPPMQQQQAVPAQLTLRQGTFVTVRINQMLSSDRNQPGDSFTAVLDRPIVIDGVTVAYRGQTVAGRVAEAQKAGRVQGTSKLGLELTDISLVDGQQLPLRSQMLARNGDTSVGSDVGAVAGTTAVGAAVGAAADWGRGAAIGAGAGAAAGVAGVLLSRGRPTVIYPEAVMTFRVETPVTISTAQAPQAFRYATAEDYGRQDGSRPPPSLHQRSDMAPQPMPYYYGPAYDPYYYGYGPSVGIYVGRGYYGRGYYRGGFRR